MDPQDLSDFLDAVRDIKGYLMALVVNYLGVSDKLDEYLVMLNKVGEEEVDPFEFYEMLIQLRGTLGVLITCYPETTPEILPCVKIIDQLTRMVQWKYA